MPRFLLDFGPGNGGLTPPPFVWFRDTASHVDLPRPAIFNSGGSTWTYYFDYTFPVPTSPLTGSIEYGVTLAGVSLTDTLLQPGAQPTRFYLDFGPGNGQLTPPTFTWYRDAVTQLALTPPAVFANAAPAWNYFFDAVFPAGTAAIEFGISLSGIFLSDVVNAPPVTLGHGGAMTLLDLRNRVREESDTEGDPNISDDSLTAWLNLSRLRLYAKLVTSFGDDYFTAQAVFNTDGISQQFPLADGTLYGGAPPFFKGEILQLIGGGVASPNAPLPVHKYNLREETRFIRPLSLLAVPQAYPRYRIMGANPNTPLNPSAPWTGNIRFSPLPSAGLVYRLLYAPKLAPLVFDSDVADDFSGWLELVILDCAIKATGKQERETGTLFTRKTELVNELNAEIANKDIGEPSTVVETGGDAFSPFGFPGAGAWGGGEWY